MEQNKGLDKPIKLETIINVMFIVGITFLIAGALNTATQIITGSILILSSMIITHLNREEGQKWMKNYKKRKIK